MTLCHQSDTRRRHAQLSSIRTERKRFLIFQTKQLSYTEKSLMLDKAELLSIRRPDGPQIDWLCADTKPTNPSIFASGQVRRLWNRG